MREIISPSEKKKEDGGGSADIVEVTDDEGKDNVDFIFFALSVCLLVCVCVLNQSHYIFS